MARVAVLGSGRMGIAAAERLSSLGHEVVVWSFRGRRLESLPEGVRQVGSLEEALGWAEHTIAFLADDEALLSVVARTSRVDGLVFANSTTVTPRASVAAGTRLEDLGACYVESPVIGGPGSLRQGKAIVLAAGRRHCFAAARDVLDGIGEVRWLGGDLGMASAVKLAYNLLAMASAVALAESMALAEGWGVDAGRLREALRGTGLQCIIDRYLDRLTSGDYKSFRAALAAKDAWYAAETLFQAGFPARLSSLIAQVYKEATLIGGEDADYTWVKKLLYTKRA